MLGGILTLESSKRRYHVVFNRTVSWAENVSIVAWCCNETKNVELRKWFILQCIKKGLTIRISVKGKKHPSKIVFRYGKQIGEIRNYLKYRELIKRTPTKCSYLV